MFRRMQLSLDKENDGKHKETKINELKSEIGPISGRSKQFCTDACFRRYLVARSWNVEKSKKMLEDTLKWRSVYKPEEILWQEIAMEGETGNIYRANFQDRDGRTVLVMRPGKQVISAALFMAERRNFKMVCLQNTKSHENQLRHLVYLFENAILNLPEGQEQMVWLIDFRGSSLSNSVLIKTARETIHVLQNHYPERLAAAFLYNPPRIFEAFWKVVKYLMDPISFQKVKFVYPENKESKELMQKHFDENILPEEFGGKSNAHYDYEEFSRLMAKDELKFANAWGSNEKPSIVKIETEPS